MFDVFLMQDTRKLLKKKSIVFLGDSNVRALYKDLLCLLRGSQFIPDRILKTKMENTVYGDKLVYHGERTNARCFREEREALIEGTHVSFFFLTRIYDDYVKGVLKKITMKSNPDVIVINSCVWDITRWGYDGVKQFKENLMSLMKEFKVLFPDCLIIWVTTPPIAQEVKGGFLVKELQFLKYSLRFHVVEANHYARKVVIDNGFDVLDTHYHLQMQLHRRYRDGIHWSLEAVRYITNLLLRHISLSWDIALPHRYKPISESENSLVFEDTSSSISAEEERKENIDDITQGCSGKSTAFSESIQNIVEQDENEKENSAPRHKMRGNKESIHHYIAKQDKKIRKKRIRGQKPYLMDNPQVSYSLPVTSVWNPSVFNPSFHTYGIMGHHPSQSYPYQYFPPSNLNHLGAGFANYGANNFSGQSAFQNYGQPYVFPQITPGQSLIPNINFINDEIPPNFNFQ